MAKQLLPFRNNTTFRMRQITSVSYSSGTSLTPIKLPEVGFLNHLILEVDGTMNVSGSPGVLVDKGPWNLLKRIQLDVNLGTSLIVDVSGFDAFLVGSTQQRAFSPNGGGNATPSTDVYSAPVANGNNTWKLMYYIPVAANNSLEFDTGLINLQAPEVQANLNITCGANADVFSSGAGTGFTGTIKVYTGYYDVPNPQVVQWPATQIVRTVSEQLPILTTGDYTWYQVPRQGILMQAIQEVRCNGSLTNAFDAAAIRINKNDTVQVIDKGVFSFRNYFNNSNVLPSGCYDWGFWNATGDPSEGDNRDMYDTERVTTFELGVQVTSGTTLGSGNNDLTTVRRILVNLSR